MLFDRRVLAACALRFCEIGLFVATFSYVNFALLSAYPLSMMPLFYFCQGLGALLLALLTRKLVLRDPQVYAFWFHGSAALLSIVSFAFISLDIPLAVFLGSLFFITLSTQVISVIATSISLAFDIREYKRVAHLVTASTGLSGLCFIAIQVPLIHLLGAEALMILVALLAGLCLVLSTQLPALRKATAPKSVDQAPIKHRLFRLILLYASLVTGATVIIDYTFKAGLRENFDADMIGIVATLFSGSVSILIFLSQLLAQRNLLQRYGAAKLLLALPLCTIPLAVLTAVTPLFGMVFLTAVVYVLLREGPTYISYQVLLNALPKMSRARANSQLYAYSSLIGRVALGAPLLLLLVTHEASIPALSLTMTLLLICLLSLVPSIRKAHVSGLAEQVEGTRYIDESQAVLLDKAAIDSTLGQLRHFARIDDVISFERCLGLLRTQESEEVDNCLGQLLDHNAANLPHGLPYTLALRALKLELSEALRKAIRVKLREDSERAIALRLALEHDYPQALRLEMESRLDMCVMRALYYFAALTDARAVLKVIPKLGAARTRQVDQEDYADALDYLDTIVEDRALKADLFHALDAHKSSSSEPDLEQVFADSWLAQVRSQPQLEPGPGMELSQKLFALRQVPPFQDLPVELLKLVAESSQELCLEAGQSVFEQGDAAGDLFVLIAGEISVEKDGQELQRLSSYTLFGELGVLGWASRKASAQALTELVLLRIDGREFNQLLDDMPVLNRALITQILTYL